MPKLLTLAEIECCQCIGRDEVGNITRIGLAELDALCETAKMAVSENKPKHSHYFKDVSSLSTVDVYRVLRLFDVADPCLQHAVKKLLVAGGRGGGKDISCDVQEAIDTLERWKAMRQEDMPVPTEGYMADPRTK